MPASDPAQPGPAGDSARVRSEQIRERRRRVAEDRGWIARAFRVVAGPTAAEEQMMADENRWRTGSEGERMLAEGLARRCPSVPVLHDRRVPGSRANIDHLAFAPSGIYVIDTKRYRGQIRVEKPWFGAAKLRIAGRDRTKLILGLEKQLGVVKRALAGIADDVPVHGCLCFVAPEGWLADVGLPAFRTLRISRAVRPSAACDAPLSSASARAQATTSDPRTCPAAAASGRSAMSPSQAAAASTPPRSGARRSAPCRSQGLRSRRRRRGWWRTARSARTGPSGSPQRRGPHPRSSR